MDASVDSLRLPDGTPIDDDMVSGTRPVAKPSHADLHYEDASTGGRKLSPADIMQFLPPGDGGVVVQALLVLDEAEDIPKRRPQPLPVRAGDFFSSLVALDDGRYAYSGAGVVQGIRCVCSA